MDLNELKLKATGLEPEQYGKIFTFIDFGNVNNWYTNDVWEWNENKLSKDEMLYVDLIKLANFCDLFSHKKFYYYGFDSEKKISLHLIIKARKHGFKVVTKPIQWIRHYLVPAEAKAYKTVFKRNTKKDRRGVYIHMPKCNFDVEMCLDTVRLVNKYDTICIWTSDNDFSLLLKYLKKMKKKVILVSGGPVRQTLKDQADLYINAQKVKGYICGKKNKKKDSTVAKSENRTRILEQGS